MDRGHPGLTARNPAGNVGIPQRNPRLRHADGDADCVGGVEPRVGSCFDAAAVEPDARQISNGISPNDSW